jgi:hypothetical protein
MCGGGVSACSRLQLLVTISTAEAEYHSLSLAVKEAILLRQMLAEFGFPQLSATPTDKDNQACIFIATTCNKSSRIKLVDIRLHFVRDAHRSGLVSIMYYLRRHEMLANTFTQLLNRAHTISKEGN